MPSRTIGEWDPRPRPELTPAPGAGLGFPPASPWVAAAPVAQSQAQGGLLAHPVCHLEAQHSPMWPSLGSKNDSRVVTG